MRKSKLVLVLSLSCASAIVACAGLDGDVSSEEDDDRGLPVKPGGVVDAGTKPASECPPDEYPWHTSSGVICAKPVASSDPEVPYDPGMPADEDIPPDVECKTETLPTAHGGSTSDACANPVKPTLYKSVLEFYKFDINYGILGKVGEHSTTRVYRLKFEWDATAGAYKAPVEDARTNHSNHWAKDDNRLKRYALIDTRATDVNGIGFKAYVNTASTYCPCTTSVGHLTDTDSCYGFVSGIFDTETHVCHGDTSVQGINFQTTAGMPVKFTNNCGDGLVYTNAPKPN